MLLSIVIGRNIVFLRKQMGISQEQLALRSDVSVSRLRDIEHGNANTTTDTLESLAKTLEVDVYLLLVLHLDEDDVLKSIRRIKLEGEIVGHGTSV